MNGRNTPPSQVEGRFVGFLWILAGYLWMVDFAPPPPPPKKKIWRARFLGPGGGGTVGIVK